ncbi:PREDICTED: uncharacterized protein LOC104759171 [Camelina sativa]|uniref:Uncharacterized protein LOC104759171 n=1 Tax=Camelina sativa TaxID=90675 RepID=A0ABM0X4C3_CAMSA|nr:PREDICTED: uncharacterized protein LOC104759171 [Camelina sativa]
MMNLRRTAVCSLHFWKRQMMIATPPPLTRRVMFSTGDGCSRPTGKAEMLRLMTHMYLHQIKMQKEKRGDGFTNPYLAKWAKHLTDEGNNESALEVYEWMANNKMEFSPSVLANAVELLRETRDQAAAEAFFNKIDPGFTSTDPFAKNWPAYRKIKRVHIPNTLTARKRLLVRYFDLGRF